MRKIYALRLLCEKNLPSSGPPFLSSCESRPNAPSANGWTSEFFVDLYKIKSVNKHEPIVFSIQLGISYLSVRFSCICYHCDVWQACSLLHKGSCRQSLCSCSFEQNSVDLWVEKDSLIVIDVSFKLKHHFANHLKVTSKPLLNIWFLQYSFTQSPQGSYNTENAVDLRYSLTKLIRFRKW